MAMRLAQSKINPLIFMGLLGMLSCSQPEIEGPEIQDIYGEFAVLEGLRSDRETVDFTAGERVGFHAQLSIRTDWTLEIIGLSSGAKKVIAGRERDITPEVLQWDGTITFAPLFGEELCMTRLVFAEYPDTLWGDTVLVTGIRPEAAVDLVLTDFESLTQPIGNFTEPASFNQRVTGTYYQNLFTSPPSFATVEPPQGTKFWVMSADHNPANIFICGASMSASAATTGDPEADYLALGTLNPDNVYFNALVYGFGDGISRLQVGLQEDDNLDGAYDRFTEGAYNAEVAVDWTGWRVVSLPLSAFARSTVGGYGNNDITGVQDLDRIIQMEFLLLAQPQTSGFCGHALDFVNFTLYAPWQP
jgi:hypothetical protein